MPETVPLDMCAQGRFRSDCANAQSDQNLHWAHYQGCKVSSCVQGRLCRSDCANAQANRGIRWAHMSKDTFFDFADWLLSLFVYRIIWCYRLY